MISKLRKNLITTILFLITINQTSQKLNFGKFKLRNLLEKSKVNEVCERANSEVKEFFETGNSKLTEIDYDNNKESIEDLLNIIDGNGDKSKSDSIKSYLKRLIPMLFFIAFGIVAIILWPISLCCLCYCKCCCCFCCCGGVNKLWKTIFFFLSGGAFVITFIMATYGLAATNNIFKSIDSTSCTLFKIVSETIDGQSKTTTPKWGGISNIQTMLLNLATFINNARTNSVSSFQSAKNNMNAAQVSFENSLDFSGYTSNDGIEVKGPTTETYPKVIPEYALFYGPKTTSGTILNSVKNEYTLLTNEIIESLNQASGNIDGAFTTSSLSNDLQDASVQITDMQDSFDKYSEMIADPWMDYQNTIVNNGKKYAKAVFSIIMVLSLGMTAIYVINYIDKCSGIQCLLKIITTVVWNILYLFSIISYIVFGFLGVVGIIGKDGSSLAHYLISNENLNKEEPRLFGNSNSIDYLKICINGDGNLKYQLNLGDSMDQLNELYSLKDTLNSHITTLSTYKESKVIKDVFTSKNYDVKFLDCNYYKGDSTSTPKAKYDFDEWFTFLNKYTSKVSGNVQNGPIFYDEFWGKTTSKSGYTYYNTVSNTKAQQNTKYLLNIYDGWTQANVEGRYDARGNTKSGSTYSTVKVAAGKVIENFQKVKTDMKNNYFTPTKNKNDVINEKFKDVSDKMVTTLEKAVLIINSVKEVIGQYLGDGNNSIYSIINCSFIGLDFKFLIKQLHNSVGKDVYSFASAMISMTVFLSIALYSSIFYMVLVKKVHDYNEENNEK